MNAMLTVLAKHLDSKFRKTMCKGDRLIAGRHKTTSLNSIYDQKYIFFLQSLKIVNIEEYSSS